MRTALYVLAWLLSIWNFAVVVGVFYAAFVVKALRGERGADART